MDILVNWLAQGSLVAVATAAVLKAIPRSRTQARYYCLWAAYLAVAALPLVPHMIDAAPDIRAAAAADIVVGPAISVPGTWWTSSAVVLGVWLTWSAAYLLRVVRDARALARARRLCRECPPSLQARLPHWMHVRSTGRQTHVVLSESVHTAAVLGVGSPVIALSPALVERLGDADLDRVVIHEWAHIQRRDDVARFVQQCVHVFAGWHPAMWWLKRHVDLEREVACDEIVVAITGGAKEYAMCLTALADVPEAPIPALAIASGSVLRRRVLRILAGRGPGGPPRWRAAAVCSTVALLAIGLVVSRVQVVASAVESVSDPSSVPIIVAAGRALAWMPAPIVHAASLADTSRTVRSPRFSAPHDARSAPQDDDRQLQPDRPETVRPQFGLSNASETVTLEQAPEVRVPHGANEGPSAAMPSIAETHVPSALAGQTESPDGTSSPRQTENKTITPWAALANTGVAVGRASQTAGVKTAGFFSRVGKSIARSF